MSEISGSADSTLVLWFPGEVIINYTMAPVRRPVTASHQQWAVTAHAQMIEQRRGFTEHYPIRNPGLKIVFVGRHRGSIAYLVRTALNLLHATNTGERATVKGDNMEDYSALEILCESEGKLGTGLRIEITPFAASACNDSANLSN